jgi:bacterial/archaeal transporter family-2 protein
MSDQIVLALIAGVMTPLQAAVNARLGRMLGSPIWAAAVSGAVLTIVLAAIGLLTTRTLPRTTGAADLPWWAWTGGLYGAFFLTATTFAMPRLGSATMIAMVVTGQVIFSLLLDRVGLFGLTAQPLTPHRVAAAYLLLAGAMLIR